MYIYYNFQKFGDNEHIDIIASNGTGKELGHIHFIHQISKKIVFISNILVREEYRNNGIGSLLIEAVIEYVQKIIGYKSIDIFSAAERLPSPIDRLFFKYGFIKNNQTYNYELKDARNHELSLRINEIPSNDKNGIMRIIESPHRIYCVTNNIVTYTASVHIYRRFRIDKDLEYDIYDFIVDFDCRKQTFFTSEKIMLLSVERILKHIEAKQMASKFNCEKIIVSHGVDKKLSNNILFKDILYPMGYKYNIEEKGFVLKLWK